MNNMLSIVPCFAVTQLVCYANVIKLHLIEMASNFITTKKEFQQLEELFSKTHPTFRVINYTLDELCLQFVNKSNEKIVLHCNASEVSETGSPMWYSECDNKTVCDVLEAVSDFPASKDHCVLRTFEFLANELCSKCQLEIPPEMEYLKQIFEVDITDADDEDSEEDFDISAIGIEDDIQAEVKKKEDENKGISTNHLAILQRIKQNERSSFETGTVTGSISASDRIMKDLRAIYKSESFKNGHYTVDIVNDNIYNWKVEILQVDSDSPLFSDLKKLKSKGKSGNASIELQLLFKDRFPFDPPFVRVVKPILTGGFVFGGGAICMELLTKQGWSSAYSVESLIMQIIATLCRGKTRIQFHARPESFSYSSAVVSFQRLVSIHEKSGWRTPPKADG